MMQHLPFEILDWVNQIKINLDHYRNDDPIDCFLETDLDYSDELHDLHNDYPLVIEKIEVTKERLSYDQLQIVKENFFPDKMKNLFLSR